MRHRDKKSKHVDDNIFFFRKQKLWCDQLALIKNKLIRISSMVLKSISFSCFGLVSRTTLSLAPCTCVSRPKHGQRQQKYSWTTLECWQNRARYIWAIFGKLRSIFLPPKSDSCSLQDLATRAELLTSTSFPNIFLVSAGNVLAKGQQHAVSPFSRPPTRRELS